MINTTERITLTVKEVCEMLGISMTLVYQLVKNNKIPYFRAGGRILFNRDLIVEWSKNPDTFKNAKEVSQ